MTKAEERKILEQIVNLIQSTPIDSYIRSAFSGVPEYAVRNIEDDAAYNPVEERDMWEKRCYDKDCDLQKFQQMHKEYRASVEKTNAELRQEIAELKDDVEFWENSSESWENNAHDAGELYCDLEKECVQKDLEIRNLKAEIVRMRLERMTDVEFAKLYERMCE